MNEPLQSRTRSLSVTDFQTSLTRGQAELFPLRIVHLYPHTGQGTDVAFIAGAGSDRYYCKRDNSLQPIRATEWLCSSLAHHLKIPVPDFSILVEPRTGETFFGSKEVWGIASPFEAQTFLTTPSEVDPAIGDPHSWLGSYLSRLYAFDLFVGNVDRQICNFLLHGRRLLAFDFAASNLSLLTSTNFPIAQTKTLSVGRLWRAIRPFDNATAIELVDWLAGVSSTVLEGMLAPMPSDWLSSDKREMLVEQWSSGTHKVRLDALRRGLIDGTLL
jgi:hypothetical protein